VLAKPVVIEDGSWIGLGAIILPGVTVGHGSIVAAGAVVDEDVPPDSYVAGNPAKVVQQLPWGNR
jgi:acetyltransferase-like isoleucine patch superfamily enzyme